MIISQWVAIFNIILSHILLKLFQLFNLFYFVLLEIKIVHETLRLLIFDFLLMAKQLASRLEQWLFLVFHTQLILFWNASFQMLLVWIAFNISQILVKELLKFIKVEVLVWVLVQFALQSGLDLIFSYLDFQRANIISLLDGLIQDPGVV